MVRMSDGRTDRVPSPTADEREQALALLRRVRQHREQMLAARGRRYFDCAADVIRELREEQEHESP